MNTTAQASVDVALRHVVVKGARVAISVTIWEQRGHHRLLQGLTGDVEQLVSEFTVVQQGEELGPKTRLILSPDTIQLT